MMTVLSVVPMVTGLWLGVINTLLTTHCVPLVPSTPLPVTVVTVGGHSFHLVR